MNEPGWKRNGRNGPLDWWLGCNDHGYEYQRGCMSCGMAEDHNIKFQQKLDCERMDRAAAPSTPAREEALRLAGAAGLDPDPEVVGVGGNDGR